MSRYGEQIRAAVSGKSPSGRGWARVNCPVCEVRHGSADRKASLGVHLLSGRWNCFRCGTRGRFDTGVEYEDAEIAPVEAAVIDPPEGYYPIFEGPGATALSFMLARNYILNDRGLDEHTARVAQVGACLTGRYRGRVVVPILDTAGRWRCFSARDFTKRAYVPYLYPPGERGGLLFNTGALAVETDRPVLVVEGVFDALAHWPDAVAVLGKPTEAHVQQFIFARRPVVFVLDGDAWEAGDALALRLRVEGVTAGSVRLAPRVDPDEIGTEELFAAAEESLTV